MATYVISDIHGEYGKFMELLDMIHFSDEDILYVLGDVVDRGKNPVKTLLKMMEMPNVIPIAGNHEQMMLECMSVLIKEVKMRILSKNLQKSLVTICSRSFMHGREMAGLQPLMS